MARCAIYCRVSSDEQTEKGTVGSQVEYAKRYLELHGPEYNIDSVEWYIDEGVSGTIPLINRPEGARLISDANSNKFTILFMYRLDRLARSVKHVLDTYELLEKKGIALKSMTEAFDTSSPTGKFFMTLLASIAALERDTILERTQMGKDRNARLGKWVSGPAPFGYRIGELGKLVIHEPEAETVRAIFKLYNEGMSMLGVTGYLNAKDIETPAISKRTKNTTGGKWHAASVSKILSADVYTGKYNYLQGSRRNRKNIETDVPIIIDIETFADIQRKVLINSDLQKGKRGRLYLLRGVVFCGHCGSAMSGNRPNENSKSYYRCPNTSDLGQGKRCTAKLMKAEDLEGSVWKDILEIVNHPEQFQEFVDKANEDNKEVALPIKGELEGIEETIISKQKSRGKILSLITRGVISDQEAERELSDLAIEIRSLTSRKETLFEQQGKSALYEEEIINAQILFDTIKQYSNTLSEDDKRNIIKGMVERIEVFTVFEGGKKIGNKATMKYWLGRCVELPVHYNLQPHTTLYSIESTWEFQAFSKIGGHRIKWS